MQAVTVIVITPAGIVVPMRRNVEHPIGASDDVCTLGKVGLVIDKDGRFYRDGVEIFGTVAID